MEKDLLMEGIYNSYESPKNLIFKEKDFKEMYDGFEAILDKDGTIYNIPNGHQIGLVCIFADQTGISRYDTAYANFLENKGFFLEAMLKETGVALLHETQVQVQKLTEEQKNAIIYLQKKKIMREKEKV